MINIKHPNKDQVVFFSSKMLAIKIAPKIVKQTFFSFFKQIKQLGWTVFQKPSPPQFFFICLYFIWAGGDENLKNYLAWPKV